MGQILKASIGAGKHHVTGEDKFAVNPCWPVDSCDDGNLYVEKILEEFATFPEGRVPDIWACEVAKRRAIQLFDPAVARAGEDKRSDTLVSTDLIKDVDQVAVKLAGEDDRPAFSVHAKHSYTVARFAQAKIWKSVAVLGHELSSGV